MVLRRAIFTADFEQGLRLDQYLASLRVNKENFRANFIRAVSLFSPDDLAFFRRLPFKARVMAIVDDDDADCVRDVPIISRLSVEVGTVLLRIFRPQQHAGVADAFDLQSARNVLPVIAFFDDHMRLLGAHEQRLPALSDWMEDRRKQWIAQHPDVADANAPPEKMSAITRTRLRIAAHSMTAAESDAWGRQTIRAWRDLLAQKND